MPTDRPVPVLSPREVELLKHAENGLTDSAIAARLGISEATVGTYWGRIRIKLGPYSRTELVANVIRMEHEAAVELLHRENEKLAQELREHSQVGGMAIYHQLLDHAPDAIIVVNSDSFVEFANLAACDLFGYGKEELDGVDLLTLMPGRFVEAHRDHCDDYIADPQRRNMGKHLSTPALRKDGTEFPVRAALSGIQTPKGLVVMCAIRAIEHS